MKKISLTKNKVAIVDDEDFEYLNQFKWYATFSSGNYYAIRGVTIEKHKQRGLTMHRVIMNAPNGVMVDHINHNTLDNRKENLRLCNNTQNQQNRILISKHTTSGFKGVTWHKRDNKWTAAIRVNGKRIYLGYHNTAEKAAHAYDDAAKKYHKEFASLNFT